MEDDRTENIHISTVERGKLCKRVSGKECLKQKNSVFWSNNNEVESRFGSADSARPLYRLRDDFHPPFTNFDNHLHRWQNISCIKIVQV